MWVKCCMIGNDDEILEEAESKHSSEIQEARRKEG
jgi:hypothetical protein